MTTLKYLGFPGSSAGKESARNVGDPSSIPGSGRSPGEGTGYQLQYFWASLVAQMVKNPMQETWVRILGWEDSLEEDMATHSSMLAWRILWTEEPRGLQSMELDKELDMTEQLTREDNGTPLQYSCPENPMDGGAWWAAVHGVAKSRT